jgi:hypothetical protein
MNTLEEPTDAASPDEAEAPTMTGDAPLLATDRCDRCGAQAYVRVMLPRTPAALVTTNITRPGELLFCGHHSGLHLAALNEVAESVQDETERLRAPATS